MSAGFFLLLTQITILTAHWIFFLGKSGLLCTAAQINHHRDHVVSLEQGSSNFPQQNPPVCAYFDLWTLPYRRVTLEKIIQGVFMQPPSLLSVCPVPTKSK